LNIRGKDTASQHRHFTNITIRGYIVNLTTSATKEGIGNQWEVVMGSERLVIGWEVEVEAGEWSLHEEVEEGVESMSGGGDGSQPCW